MFENGINIYYDEASTIWILICHIRMYNLFCVLNLLIREKYMSHSMQGKQLFKPKPKPSLLGKWGNYMVDRGKISFVY